MNNIQQINGKKILLQVKDNILDAKAWAKENKEGIDNFLSTNGAILIRGLKIAGPEDFALILKNLFGEDLVEYNNRSTPRTELKNRIYTATEYHPSETIPQHNENAYSNSWPMRIGFLCMIPAKMGGNTPISDSRIAYQQIPQEIRDEFEKKKVMYVRNYSNIDLPWTEVFQTKEKTEVEKYCKANNIEFAWLSTGLRTKQIVQASLVHPISKEKLWFNQAHLFHISNLDEELREGLIQMSGGEENVPRNAYFGDGTAIDEDSLSIIRKVYDDTKFSFQWEKSDLLLLDNMLFTHGREPFLGPRQVLVGMAKEYHSPQNDMDI